MNEIGFNEWMKNYLEPQESENAGKIKEIFAENSVYWWGPYSQPRHGLDAIYEHHRNALSHQKDTKYEFEILAVTPAYGIAHFTLSLRSLETGAPNYYEGIFQVFLDSAGRCTLFKEWYHYSEKPNQPN